MFGNTPKSTKVIRLNSHSSFAFGVRFFRGDGSPVNLTGAEIRFTVREPARRGGDVVITKTADVVNAELGLMQIRLQATDTDLTKGSYPFSLVLETALNYVVPVLDGVLEINPSNDNDTDGTFPVTNPGTTIAAYVQDNNVINVTVQQVDGLTVVLNAVIDEFQDFVEVKTAEVAASAATAVGKYAQIVTAAGTASTKATEAAASAAAAAASASGASASAADANTSKNTAATSATTATTQAATATTARVAAQAAAATATTEATDAGGSAVQAGLYAADADASAIAAAASAATAEAAVVDVEEATDAAAAAAVSAAAAHASELAAINKASEASSWATNAATNAGNAATSAGAAAASATTAAGHAVTASTGATTATTKAGQASTSQTAAAASATTAGTAASTATGAATAASVSAAAALVSQNAAQDAADAVAELFYLVTDCDDAVTTGWACNDGLAANRPDGTAVFMIEVVAHSGTSNVVKQRLYAPLYGAYVAGEFTREFDGTDWTDWVEAPTSIYELPKRLDLAPTDTPPSNDSRSASSGWYQIDGSTTNVPLPSEPGVLFVAAAGDDSRLMTATQAGRTFTSSFNSSAGEWTQWSETTRWDTDWVDLKDEFSPALPANHLLARRRGTKVMVQFDPLVGLTPGWMDDLAGKNMPDGWRPCVPSIGQTHIVIPLVTDDDSSVGQLLLREEFSVIGIVPSGGVGAGYTEFETDNDWPVDYPPYIS